MTDVSESGPSTGAPDQAAIRADIEAVRREYHELLESLTAEDWKQKSGNPSWRVGQLMWHMAWGLQYFPQGIEECRKGKAMNPPAWLMNPANTLITKIGSRGATPEKVAQKYDAAHKKMLAAVEGIGDDEWGKGVRSFGSDNTIESLCHDVRRHFEEHKADIMKGLGRA